ncbi:dTMP kinase [Thermodesulfovibrio thiophilus]|uniref:dTMP kinase n=1 Tax=Thermodesulfovibrio thiophilus TaxID=340095 RepID=UPI0017E56959|nr:dTMP kinase [Thermodesulfovibrio thiophilus]HHW19859.1 dTMP kinase [Thermodesulfovibrio thiophilus]
MDKGIFITFEGIEGSGKTTQIKLLGERLKKQGLKVLTTYEPGDTDVGQKIRNILLEPEINIDPLCELILYFADRVQHVNEKIKPYLEAGFIVICDRFTDSTVAYQGYARGVSIDIIKELNRILFNEFKPDLTILLDLPVIIGLKRNQQINKTDRFELEDLAFHDRVREGYLKLAEIEPERFFILDATKSQIELAEEIYKTIKLRFHL